MAEKSEKKDVPITIKIWDSLRVVLEQIGHEEDRPVGYVVRELMLRGLVLYKQDGKLRREQADVDAADQVVPVHDEGSIGKKPQQRKKAK